ncbi:hypothetical protein EK904_006160 [Melospiza melodia maxima]|nr:hypothetical protein EK904_006160 [Melospiza melodia maxima]
MLENQMQMRRQRPVKCITGPEQSSRKMTKPPPLLAQLQLSKHLEIPCRGILGWRKDADWSRAGKKRCDLEQ